MEQSTTYTMGSLDRSARWGVDGRLCQISPRFGGEAGYWPQCPAAMTDAEPGSWWQVDLVSPTDLTRVDVWLVANTPIRLYVSDDGQRWVLVGEDGGRLIPPMRFDVQRRTRYVRVERPSPESMTLSEVEVWVR